jgi:hypothetical protein
MFFFSGRRLQTTGRTETTCLQLAEGTRNLQLPQKKNYGKNQGNFKNSSRKKKILRNILTLFRFEQSSDGENACLV